MKRWIIAVVLGGITGCGGPAAPVKIAYTEVSLFNNGAVRELVGVIDSIDKLDLSFSFPGKIATVSADLGDEVSQNQQLAALADDQFRIQKATADANLAATQEQLKAAGEKLKVADQMLKANVGSKKDYDAALATYQSIQAGIGDQEKAVQVAAGELNRTVLRTPKAGFVAKRNVAVGDFVGAHQTLFEIHPSASLRVRLNIPQDLLKFVAKNDPVRIDVPDTNQKGLIGVLDSLDPVPPQSNAAPALVTIENQTGLRAGMKANVLLSVQDKAKPVWWLPLKVVLNAQENSTGVVYIYLSQEGIVKKQTIETGQLNGDLIAVTKGLKEGDKVVSQAASSITDGQQVTAVTAEEIPVYKQQNLELNH